VNQQIIEPHCISCHSGSGSAGTKLNFSSYDSLIAASVVTAGNAGASSLYLQTNSGAMPLGGPALSAQQVQLIEQWIQNGATDD
jgi:mono/diheme cytochrome c family protein